LGRGGLAQNPPSSGADLAYTGGWQTGPTRRRPKNQGNVSNLVVRLQRLGLIYLRDGDKTIYRNKDEWSGQGTLF
jgi:hypothetical protein